MSKKKGVNWVEAIAGAAIIAGGVGSSATCTIGTAGVCSVAGVPVSAASLTAGSALIADSFLHIVWK